MKECTWRDCKEVAEFPQLDRDGKEWSNLCSKHHNEQAEAIKVGNVKKMLSCWVKARGGAKKCTEDCAPVAAVGAKLMKLLSGDHND